jgi:hypothetical protein
MPKCLTASRVDLLPRSKMVFEPTGARRASWSKVKASPPAFKIRSFAEVVKRRAAMDSFGISNNRTSSVTVPTFTMIFESRSDAEEVSLIIFDRERGGRLVFERKSRRRRTWFQRWVALSTYSTSATRTLLNFESVRRARKR